MVLVINNLPASVGDIKEAGSIPGSERPPGGGNGYHSSTLAWRIPWTEEPGGLQPMGLQRVGHNLGDSTDKPHYGHPSHNPSITFFLFL